MPIINHFTPNRAIDVIDSSNDDNVQVSMNDWHDRIVLIVLACAGERRKDNQLIR